jgi:hypothetical protein
MECFTLRAYLKSPIIRQGYLTLDALLMAELGRGDVSDLIRCDDGLYHASAAFLADEVDSQPAAFVASMRPERTPQWLDVIQPFTRNTLGELDVGIGERRAREAGNVISTYTARVAGSAEWYATGDREAVLRALRHVRFIGKRRAAGYGEVLRWEAEAGELDGIAGYLSEPLRPVPVSRWPHGGDHIPIDTAWRPAYWEIRNRAKCFAPPV